MIPQQSEHKFQSEYTVVVVLELVAKYPNKAGNLPVSVTYRMPVTAESGEMAALLAGLRLGRVEGEWSVVVKSLGVNL